MSWLAFFEQQGFTVHLTTMIPPVHNLRSSIEGRPYGWCWNYGRDFREEAMRANEIIDSRDHIARYHHLCTAP